MVGNLSVNQSPDGWVARVEEMHDDGTAAAFVEDLPPRFETKKWTAWDSK